VQEPEQPEQEQTIIADETLESGDQSDD